MPLAQCPVIVSSSQGKSQLSDISWVSTLFSLQSFNFHVIKSPLPTKQRKISSEDQNISNFLVIDLI